MDITLTWAEKSVIIAKLFNLPFIYKKSVITWLKTKLFLQSTEKSIIW